MIIAAHQPNYLPNLGFFYKMSQVDKFIVFTSVQFSKEDGWVRRHKIPSSTGDIWLTVPVLGSGFGQKIADVKISNILPWKRKHSKTIETMYSKTREQDFLKNLLAVYDQEWTTLPALNFAFIQLIVDVLGIKTELIFDEEVSGEKQNLLINLCKKYEADAYLSGMGGKEYMTDDYYQDLNTNEINHHFVQSNLTAHYPYTTIHYIFTEGVETVASWVQNECKFTTHSPAALTI